MSEVGPAEEIEEIVGVSRHPRAHYGRAVSSENRFYILHSQICKEDIQDLRDCVYSLALDNGLNMKIWEDLQDRPILLQVIDGQLYPALAGSA